MTAMACIPLTRTPATVEEFRTIIAKLQAEIDDLSTRVEQLESKQGSWFDRVFKG